MGTPDRLPRVLLVAEAVTLAHVARPAALLDALDPGCFDSFLACDPRARKFLTIEETRLRSIHSIESRTFSERLRRGAPLYDVPTLEDYVREDLALIDEVKPDVVVGDFRLSLSVSARLAGVPYACITNAYWSPYSPTDSMPLPVLPWTPYVPLALAQRAFDWLRPMVFAAHCRPLNQVRVNHGLAPLPTDLRRIYTDSDQTLYADDPRIFPLKEAPSSHCHIGPVLWSPPGILPAWWHEVDPDLPLVYVTMGSSGNSRMLDAVIDTLAVLPVGVLASTAGAPVSSTPRRKNVWVAEYLPGEQAAARSRLVICNGGSPTSQQAIAAGVPVIGISENMDQMLNMRALAAAGLGIALRADRFSASALTSATSNLLNGFRARAGSATQLDPGRSEDATAERFRAALAQLLQAGASNPVGR